MGHTIETWRSLTTHSSHFCLRKFSNFRPSLHALQHLCRASCVKVSPAPNNPHETLPGQYDQLSSTTLIAPLGWRIGANQGSYIEGSYWVCGITVCCDKAFQCTLQLLFLGRGYATRPSRSEQAVHPRL